MSAHQTEDPSTLKAEIREKYNTLAHWYVLVERILEVLGVRILRRRLLQRASGKVLEVAVGTGKNLRYYPKACQIFATDFSPAMLAIARKRAKRLGRKRSRGNDQLGDPTP